MTDPLGRLRRSTIGRAAVVAVIGRCMGLLSVLVTAPLLIGDIGAAGYGCLITLVTLLALINLADLGLGNGLITSAARNAHDLTRVGSSLRAARRTTAGTVAVVSVAVIGVTVVSGWSWLLAPPSSLRTSVDVALPVAAGITLATAPLGLSSKTLSGLGETVSVAWGSVLTAVLQCLTVAACAATGQSFVVIVGAYSLPQLVSALVLHLRLTAVMHARSRQQSAPVANENAEQPPDLRGANWPFLALALVTLIAYESDALVLAHLRTQREVAEYALSYRLFMVVPMLVAVALQPLWPAYAAADVRNDRAWIRRRLVASLRLAVTVNVAWGLLLVALGPTLLRLWVGSDPPSPPGLRLAMLAFVAVNGLTGPIAVALNGLGQMRFQLGLAPLMALVNVALSLVLTSSIGVAGPIWGTVVAQSLVIIIPSLHRLLSPSGSGRIVEEPGSLTRTALSPSLRS